LDDVTIAGATSVLINVTGSSDLTMFEITEASTMIQEEAHEDANVIWGWVVDETMGDEARVTVIATGFDESFLAATPSVERRVAEAMRGGRLVANGGNNGGYRGPAGGSGMVSGLNPDDYDIPTFYKNAD
jgi:cell division protein FtsZ